jgi:hypothetical protein
VQRRSGAITLPAEGDAVYVYGNSTATAIGFFTATAANTFTVPLGLFSVIYVTRRNRRTV